MATINDDCNFCGAKYSDSNKKITRNNVSFCQECVKIIDEMRSPSKTCDGCGDTNVHKHRMYYLPCGSKMCKACLEDEHVKVCKTCSPDEEEEDE